MSKIGKKPIIIPEGVNIEFKDGILKFKGNKGEITLKTLPFIKTDLSDKEISFSTDSDFKQARANWGTMRALSDNAVLGVSRGFSKTLEIEGVGFRASMEGNNLVLSVGFSHPVKIIPPAGATISVEKNTINVSGVDKDLVGKVAAKIKAVKKPEPYKGKGIRYKGEIIRRKEGKKAAGATK